MPRITNVGTIDWSGCNIFTLAERIAELEKQHEQSFDDLYDKACECIGIPNSFQANAHLERHLEAAEQLEKPHLSLQVTIKLDEEVNPSQGLPPICRTQPIGNEYYVWQTQATRNTTIWNRHPIFWIVAGLTSMTHHEVRAELKKADMKTVILTFHLSEDVRKPSRFLHALCNKMGRWGAEAVLAAKVI